MQRDNSYEESRNDNYNAYSKVSTLVKIAKIQEYQ